MSVASIVAVLMLGQPTPIYYEEIQLEALNDCMPHFTHKEFGMRQTILEEMIELERDFFKTHPEIPSSLRGMLISAICRESRFNPNAKGDWRTNRKGKRVAKAIGIVQMWPWWKDAYKIDRRDYTSAAVAWLNRIVYHYKKNERLKRCPKYFSEKRKWIAAWVQTTRGAPVNKANRYRCFQAPSHYRTLKKWIKRIEKKRKIDFEDGC